MARPRKHTYTLDMYLKKIRKGDIDNNADVQRNFVWNNEQINELIVTVLTDDYIPPIILGEEEDTKLHIVDGGCRTAALRKFREMNYKITSSVENSRIPYKKKIVDQEGEIAYEDAVFDIKNKTYEKLPEELKEKFDEYQIETVIHECCDSARISRYIKRYNNHVAMNTDQKAFTYIDRYAHRIRRILDSRFFVECTGYSEKDKTKGVVERMVVEAMMCMNHFDDWKTQPRAACKYLNAHASEKEFDVFEEYIHRLENIVTDEMKNLFNKKDAFIFLTLFDRFAKLGIKDEKFAEFLSKFHKKLRYTARNEKGLQFDEIDRELSTKDRQVITDKLNMLESLMWDCIQAGGKGKRSTAKKQSATGEQSSVEKRSETGEFLSGEKRSETGEQSSGEKRSETGKQSSAEKRSEIGKRSMEEELPETAESIIREFVDGSVDDRDMELYELLANDASEVIEDIDSEFLSDENRPSFVALVSYAVRKDTDELLKDWLTAFEKQGKLLRDQKEIFIYMKVEFDRYLTGCSAGSDTHGR